TDSPVNPQKHFSSRFGTYIHLLFTIIYLLLFPLRAWANVSCMNCLQLLLLAVLPHARATEKYEKPAIFLTVADEEIPKGSQYSKGNEKINNSKKAVLLYL